MRIIKTCGSIIEIHVFNFDKQSYSEQIPVKKFSHDHFWSDLYCFFSVQVAKKNKVCRQKFFL